MLDRVARLERALYPSAPRLLGVVLSIVVAALVVFPLLGVRLPNFSQYLLTAGFDGMNMAGLMGIFVLYLCARPATGHAQIITLLALVMEVVLYTQRPAELGPWQRLNLLGLGFAVAGFSGMAHLALTTTGAARRRLLGLLSVAGVLLLYGSLSVVFLGLLSHLTPLVFDAYIYRLESATGTPWPMLVARLVESNPLLQNVVTGTYVRLTLFVAIGFYLNLRYPSATTSNLIAGFLLALLLCFPLYLILPMVGIDHFIGSPPWPMGLAPTEYVVKWIPAPPWLPRTCAPSLHAAWVYLLFFSVYRLGRIHAAWSLVVVVLTLMGTMSKTVGHYFVDIVLSLPLAVAVQAAVTFATPGNQRQRRLVVVSGLAFTVFSCALLRLAPDWVNSFAGPFLLIQATAIVWFLRAERHLGRQTQEELASEEGKRRSQTESLEDDRGQSNAASISPTA